MRARLLAVLLGILIILAALPSRQAWALDAEDLADACQNVENFEAGFCFGLIQGISFIMATNCIDFPEGDGLSRIDRSADARLFKQVFLNWLEDNPQEKKTAAQVAVMVALSAFAPCEKIVYG